MASYKFDLHEKRLLPIICQYLLKMWGGRWKQIDDFRMLMRGGECKKCQNGCVIFLEICHDKITAYRERIYIKFLPYHT